MLHGDDDGIVFRRLDPHEGDVLTSAIVAAYGSTYAVRWVYDADEVRARLADGRYVSVVAETATGNLLCHMGMSMAAAGDAVGHAGQAVTLAAARGQHLFTRTKRFLMEWAREHGLAGLYSEVTAAHPYSQKANLDVGAKETGFLLGWIPASVANDAATSAGRRRQSAAFFYAKLNDGHDRPVYAPERHHDVIGRTLRLCALRGALAEPPPAATLAQRTEMTVDVDRDHNLALITVTVPGADLEEVVRARRHRLFHHDRVDAVYVDLPLVAPATALVSDHLEALGVSYSGIFPNHRADGDVLRMQSLHGVRITADDVVVASDHGRTITAPADGYCYGGPDCDPAPLDVPIPADGNAEGSADYTCDTSKDDCHVLVVETAQRRLYELYNATQDGASHTALGAFVWDLTKVYPDGMRGEQCTSADAAGFPIAGLLPTADEVAAGEVAHALRFVLPNERIKAGVYVHPAGHAGGPRSDNADAPPYGVRFRLRSSFDETSFNASERVVLRALKTYGMFLSDGGDIALTFADDRHSVAKWSALGVDAQSFAAIGPRNFEVVDLGPEIGLTFNCLRNP